MKYTSIIILILASSLLSFAQKSSVGFIENKGQIVDQYNNVNTAVRYLYNADGLNVQLKENSFSYDTWTVEWKKIEQTEAEKQMYGHLPEEMQMPKEEPTIKFHRVDIVLDGANKTPAIEAMESLPGVDNYYLAGINEVTGVHTYKKVLYRNIYPNIDLEFFLSDKIKVNSGSFEYQFIVRPGGNPSDIKLRYLGSDGTELSDDAIKVNVRQGSFLEHIPLSYVKEDSKVVKVSYSKLDANLYGFDVESYPSNKTLIIDPAPQLLWSTYYGGMQWDRLRGIIYDTQDNVIVCGHGFSTINIATAGSHQAVIGGNYDAYVAKFNTLGVRLWGTYYGGLLLDESRKVIADAAGDIYVTGTTKSPSGIATAGAHQTVHSGGPAGNEFDGFLVKFNASGVRQWGTYYGGSGWDELWNLKKDVFNNIVVTGVSTSTNNISTAGAYQIAFSGSSVADAIVAKFTDTGVLTWGTYYGDVEMDFGYAIETDLAGNIYFGGITQSVNLIASAGAHQTTLSGTDEGFLVKLSPAGTRLWGTYVGGSAYDIIWSIVASGTGDPIVLGETYAADGISTAGAYQVVYGGSRDAFMMKFNSAGTRQWGTYIGGLLDDFGNSIKVDLTDNLFIGGCTKNATGFGTPGSFQPNMNGTEDAIVMKFTNAGALVWSTYFGGNGNDAVFDIAVNPSNHIYICGDTRSTTGLSTPGAHQVAFSGTVSQDGFVAKLVDCSMSLATTSTLVSCYGLSDGTATVTPSDGTYPFGYLWDSFQTDSTATGLPAGTFYVTVVDSRGCRMNDSAEVFQPDLLTTLTSGTDAICFGSSDGAVQATPSGGTTPYGYSWDSGCNTQVCNGLPMGTYNVTVSDVNSCSTTGQISISQPDIITIAITTTPVLCHSGSDGTAAAVVGGGVPGYVYLWPNFDTNPSTSGLSAGTYTLTVADSHLCPMTASFTVAEPDTLSMTFTPTAVTCFGFNNGYVVVTAGGGVSPYEYLWENGDTTSTADTLIAGFYDITLTDFNNCVISGQAEITQPTILQVALAQDSVNCHASSDGLATSIAFGGTPGYTYSWSSGSDSSSAGSLIAGQYILTLTDNNLCVLIDSIDVFEPDTIQINFINTTTLCFSDSTGGAVAQTSGGTIPYSLVWSAGSVSDSLSGLPAGTYIVSVTDVHGCFFVDSTQVIEPDSMQFSFSTDSVNCFQGSDGVAMTLINGGTSPYSFDWSNGMTGDTITGLAAGIYQVTATDANGCFNVDHTTIHEPTDLRINVNYGDLTCFESNDGWATVSAIGGTPPYQFLWSTTQTADSIYNLPAGPYSVTVTDSRGCTESHSFTIDQPDLLVSLDYSVDVICNGDNSGIAGLNVTGGTVPYAFEWSNGYDQQSDSSIVAGTYFVTITDSHNCITYDTIFVVQPDLLILNLATQNVVCYNEGNGWASTTVSGGILPYQVLWSTGDTIMNIDSLTPGNYSVQILDSNLCIAEQVFVITQPDSLYYDYSISNVSCYEFADGGLVGTVYGGTEPYEIILYNMLGQSVPFQNLDDGLYIVNVTDSLGCKYVEHIVITQPDTLDIQANYGIAATDNYGFVDITTTGGTLPYSYQWSNLTTQEDISHLIGGNYIVTVTDAHGCVSTYSAFIDLILTIPNVITPNADGVNDDFEVLNLEAYQTVRVEVYNRWSTLLYQFTGSGSEYNNGNRFNGVVDGKNLPMGSYLYIIVLNETETFNGPLLIKY